MDCRRHWVNTVLLLVLLCWSAAVPVWAAEKTLNFWHGNFTAPVLAWLEAEIFPQFEKEYGVKINHMNIGWAANRTDKLITSIVAGAGPDVLVIGGNYHVTEAVILQPLDKYVAQWPDAARFPEPIWETKRYKGQLMGVPLGGGIRGMAYNSLHFAESGLPDKAPDSWEEWLTVVRKTTRVDNNTLTRAGFEWPWSEIEYNWLIMMNGSDIIHPETFASQMRDPRAMEALEFMRDLYQAAHPDNLPAYKWREYANGKASMMYALPTTLKYVQDNNPDIAEVTRIYSPRRTPQHEPVTLAFIDGYGIPIGAQDPDLSWKFIEFMSSNEIMLGMVANGLDYMPLRNDVIGSAARFMAPYLPFYDLMPSSRQGIPGPFDSVVRSNILKFITPTLRGTMSPAQAVENIDQVITTFINEFNQQQAK
ncbi:MAG: extracellular solute-binding protein [Limnochordia bacterium]|jgi:ABC-type glycerol-3-phosphate transport system substrate-binding protein